MFKWFYYSILFVGVTFAACKPKSLPNETIEPQSNSCEALGYDRPELEVLKANSFQIDDTAARQDFALALVSCLGSADPTLRDEIAYEGFVTLLRGQHLQTDTVQALRTNLIKILRNDDDAAGYRKPFAALVLAEVARVDRVQPYLTEIERKDLVGVATEYLANVSDYRGYNDQDGWRHGVAHSADILMQLSLNRAITPDDQMKILDAVSRQIAPESGHVYIFGEPERLARPVLFLAARKELSEEVWANWFEVNQQPFPLEAWGDAYKSEAGLAKLHNTKAFFNALYINSSNSQNENIRALAEPSLSSLKILP